MKPNCIGDMMPNRTMEWFIFGPAIVAFLLALAPMGDWKINAAGYAFAVVWLVASFAAILVTWRGLALMAVFASFLVPWVAIMQAHPGPAGFVAALFFAAISAQLTRDLFSRALQKREEIF